MRRPPDRHRMLRHPRCGNARGVGVVDAMIENEQLEVRRSQAARSITHSAYQMACAAHISLTGLHWHRGHEVANLDDRWLTLESHTGAMTEHFPNEWLEALDQSAADDPRIARCLAGMIEALAAR